MEPSKKKPLILYAYVSQLAIMFLTLTIGGYLLGKFVIFKTDLAGGIISTIGAIVGVIIFIMGVLKIDRGKK